MGYRTDFTGTLYFTTEFTREQEGYLNSILSQDCRKHPEWNTFDLTWVDLEIDYDKLSNPVGIKWDDSEKTYDIVEKVNLILELMRKKWPDFNLEGEMIAQGQACDDRWVLYMEDYLAKSKEVDDSDMIDIATSKEIDGYRIDFIDDIRGPNIFISVNKKDMDIINQNYEDIGFDKYDTYKEFIESLIKEEISTIGNKIR